MHRKSQNWLSQFDLAVTTFLRKAAWLFALSFALGSLLFFLFRFTIGWSVYYFMLTPMYPEQTPFQYIGVLTLVYAVVGAGWLVFWGNSHGWKRRLGIMIAVLTSVVAACPLEGMLFALHKVQDYQHYTDLPAAIAYGAQLGLLYGPIMLLFSVPMNIYAFIIGYFILDCVAPQPPKAFPKRNPYR